MTTRNSHMGNHAAVSRFFMLFSVCHEDVRKVSIPSVLFSLRGVECACVPLPLVVLFCCLLLFCYLLFCMCVNDRCFGKFLRCDTVGFAGWCERYGICAYDVLRHSIGAKILECGVQFCLCRQPCGMRVCRMLGKQCYCLAKFRIGHFRNA